MQRVKFNVKMEYEYLENFKILQKAFKMHRIDKVDGQRCSALPLTVAICELTRYSRYWWTNWSSAKCRTISSFCSG